MDPVIKAFYEHLLQNPEDWDSRKQLADYYEDQGDLILAEGQRWQIREKKRPSRGLVRAQIYEDIGDWLIEHENPTWVLPFNLFNVLQQYNDEWTNRKRSVSFQKAEIALAMALKELNNESQRMLESAVE